MSRFYGDLQGGRGIATRQGTTNSGIDSHVRGWDTGARVICDVVELLVDGKPRKVDRVRVYRTGGSHNSGGDLIAEWKDGDLAPAFYK